VLAPGLLPGSYSGSAALENYYLLPAIRADFLARTGEKSKARQNLEKALTLTDSPAEKELLKRDRRIVVRPTKIQFQENHNNMVESAIFLR